MNDGSHKLNTPFLQILHNALIAWLEDTAVFDQALVQKLLVEAENLYQVLDAGLQHEATWEVAAWVLCQTRLFASQLSQQGAWLGLVARVLVWCQEPKQLRAELLLVQGQLRRDVGELEAAFAAFAEAERLVVALDDPELAIRLLYNQAETYLTEGQPQIAKQLCQQALEQLEELPAMPYWRAAILNILGTSQRDLSDLDGAQVSLKQALALEEAMGNTLAYVRALNSLGSTHAAAGQPEQAHAAYSLCLTLLADTPYNNDKLLVYSSAGSLYVGQSQLEKAEKLFTEALTLIRSTPVPHSSQAIAFNNLGYLFFLQNLFEKARYFLGEAIRLRRTLPQVLRLANSIGSLGEVLLREGDKEGARKAFDEALQLVELWQHVPWGVRLRQKFTEQRVRVM